MADARLEAELIDQARMQISDPNAEVHRRMAVVSAVSLAGGTCSITIAGSATVVAGVRFLRDSVPRVNDVVWCIETGGDYLVIGIQALGGASWTPTVSGGTWAIGNGTATGVYQIVGGWCFVHGLITFGSTSVFGGGTGLTIGGLPVATRAGQPTTLYLEMFSGATTTFPGWTKIAAGATSGTAWYDATFAAPGNTFYAAVANAGPAAWQAANTIIIEGSYPI